jgi:hypothetical protein
VAKSLHNRHGFLWLGLVATWLPRRRNSASSRPGEAFKNKKVHPVTAAVDRLQHLQQPKLDTAAHQAADDMQDPSRAGGS